MQLQQQLEESRRNAQQLLSAGQELAGRPAVIDVPGSIGHRRSHGCIRMRNRDVEELFERLRPGDVVELRGETTPDIAALFVG